MAAVGRHGMVHRRPTRAARYAWFVCLRLGAGAARQRPQHSLRSVRPASGLAVSARPALHDSTVRDAWAISPRPTSALRSLAVHLLEHTDNDVRTAALLDSFKCLHLASDS